MATEPLAQLIAATRAALSLAGMTRHDLDGSVYWSGGSGPRTVVLLHGVNDQAGTWAAVAPKLTSKFRVVVPDLAGHGESAPAEGAFGMQTIIDRLHAILERECAGKKVTLVGNSMGAWVSILYALAHPDGVEMLVLESGGGLALPLGVPLTARTREEASVILRAVHGPDAVLPDWATDALLERSTDSPMLRLMQGGLLQYFVDARLSQITVPTTLLWGANDGVVPRTYMETLRAGIRGSKLKVIEGAAHIPHQQQPEKFVACLMESFSQNAHA